MTPAAVLLGAGIVALGLYFGLQGHRDERGAMGAEPSIVPGHATATAVPVAEESESGPPPPVVVLSGTPSRVDQAQKDAAIVVASEKERAYLPKCWAPALAVAPMPAHARYTLSLSFDQHGRQTAQAFSLHRDAERADVGRCLSALPMNLQIPAPGRPVSVLVELELP